MRDFLCLSKLRSKPILMGIMCNLYRREAINQFSARTHARLGSTMPLTYHDWTHPASHFIPYQVPSSTYLYVR